MVQLMNIRDALRRIDTSMLRHELPDPRDLEIWKLAHDTE